MPKYLLGLSTGSITVGLALIFLGPNLFPNISISYSVFWLLIAGALMGSGIGLVGHYMENLKFYVSGTFLGIIIFGISGIVLDTNTLYSILLGIGLALVTGFIVDNFGINDWTKMESSTDSEEQSEPINH
ncbi:MAG: hypothetical protein K9N46_17310 [Candidatus Marinimicrobia bacterium]|nr:hypothetical protein [Candidatus Neomarinimicrobiota bacterium]MCF7830119.1 hypothetical protein [Candidatus Neomarinimicrobiota bacterium]MCF7882488.1 hypothetical protein [Candidatus Neomarinimicrobiota bacterium]